MGQIDWAEIWRKHDEWWDEESRKPRQWELSWQKQKLKIEELVEGQLRGRKKEESGTRCRP